MHFLFLYTRLTDYFLKCIHFLVYEHCPTATATVVVYPPDPNAPYHFEEDAKINIILKDTFFQCDLVFNPDIIYKTGWGDKEYNEYTRSFKNKVPIVVGLDNFWEGTWRQRIACLLAPWLIHPHVPLIWCAGKPQKQYAKKLGFEENQIRENLYCADVNLYQPEIALSRKEIIFVGRLVDFKRPSWLLKAFEECINEEVSLRDWKLKIVGNGPLKESLISTYKSDNIEFLAFMPPSQLKEHYDTASIFCLPSHYEHWGVVVHEAAAAGLALLLSDTCGAASTFLEDHINGYIFKSDDFSDFKNKLKQLMSLDSNQLRAFQNKSILHSNRITHKIWCDTFLSFKYEK